MAKLIVFLAQDQMLRASLFYESSTFSLFTQTQHLTLDFAFMMLHSIYIFAFSAWLMLYKLNKPAALAKPKRCDRGSAGVRTHSTLDIKRLDWASHHWATEQQKMCHSLHQPLLTKCVSLRPINHNSQKKIKLKTEWEKETSSSFLILSPHCSEKYCFLELKNNPSTIKSYCTQLDWPQLSPTEPDWARLSPIKPDQAPSSPTEPN